MNDVFFALLSVLILSIYYFNMAPTGPILPMYKFSGYAYERAKSNAFTVILIAVPLTIFAINFIYNKVDEEKEAILVAFDDTKKAIKSRLVMPKLPILCQKKTVVKRKKKRKKTSHFLSQKELKIMAASSAITLVLTYIYYEAINRR